MNKRKKVIIFDMDGTLVDSSITIVNAINYVRKKLNLPSLEKELILKKVNDPQLNPALFFYETESFNQEQEQWFSEYYSNHHEKELKLYSGIKELLTGLQKRNYLLAVATNAYRVSTLESLTHLNVVNCFSSISCYDDVGAAKPAPDMLEKILKETSSKALEAIFIGDSERDLLAAQALNMNYIMVNWGFSNYENAINTIDKLEEKILEYEDESL